MNSIIGLDNYAESSKFIESQVIIFEKQIVSKQNALKNF